MNGPVATFNKTTYTINQVDSLPPKVSDTDFVPPNGVIYFFFSDSLTGGIEGVNASYLDGNGNVLSGRAIARTDTSRGVRIQELIEAGMNSGETNEFPSVLNDPLSHDTLQEKDYMLSNVKYFRPTRNEDSGLTGWRDENPSDYVVNQ